MEWLSSYCYWYSIHFIIHARTYNNYIINIIILYIFTFWQQGWGTQFLSGPNSNILMEVTVPVWTQERCKEAFGLRIFDSNICAGDGGRDSCQVNFFFI